jgi:hypothetical protein
VDRDTIQTTHIYPGCDRGLLTGTCCKTSQCVCWYCCAGGGGAHACHPPWQPPPTAAVKLAGGEGGQVYPGRGSCWYYVIDCPWGTAAAAGHSTVGLSGQGSTACSIYGTPTQEGAMQTAWYCQALPVPCMQGSAAWGDRALSCSRCCVAMLSCHASRRTVC